MISMETPVVFVGCTVFALVIVGFITSAFYKSSSNVNGSLCKERRENIKTLISNRIDVLEDKIDHVDAKVDHLIELIEGSKYAKYNIRKQ